MIGSEERWTPEEGEDGFPECDTNVSPLGKLVLTGLFYGVIGIGAGFWVWAGAVFVRSLWMWLVCG